VRQNLGSDDKLLWFQINQLTMRLTGKFNPSSPKSSLKEKEEVE
jgi:hypothetical protein